MAVKLDLSQIIKEEIIEAGAILSAKSMLPATSGNLSGRNKETNTIFISSSGKDKGKLTTEDFLELPLNANLAELEFIKHKPSAETLLHTQLYNFSSNINSVLHVHANSSVIISKLFAASREIKLTNYELLKALDGVSTHKHIETIPIFANTQNIKLLAAEVEQYMQHNPNIHAYLIEGHGLYTWGQNTQTALRHVDALDTLFTCTIELLKCQN